MDKEKPAMAKAGEKEIFQVRRTAQCRDPKVGIVGSSEERKGLECRKKGWR